MRIKLVYIPVLLVLLPFLSCRKELSVEKKSWQAGDFRALIDGAQWIAADSAKGAYVLGGLINISGVSGDNKQLSITLNDTIPGVYMLDQSSISVAAYADHDSSDIYAFATNQGLDTSQAGGQVIVTEIDKVNKTLSGTFSFKLYRDIDNRRKTLTQGVFYKLPYASSLPSANGTDSMRATIDGANWAAQSITASSLSTQLAIYGSLSNGSQSVDLLMPVDITPGSYNLDITGLTYVGVYSPASTVSLASISGTLVILEHNVSTGRIRGNFQFQASDPLNSRHSSLTKGYFSVKYGP